MRLLRLDLHAFGVFEDVSIDLGRADSAEPGLTIVYGLNEAGKSTALRAVRQLFFGIDGDRDAFRVAKAKLRIGGLLRDDDGNQCGGVRRGSKKDWLYDADDKKRLPDDSPFAKLLDRLDPATYETAYGLDHDALKSGAEAIAASEGSLDAALYAATARVKDLQAFHRSLIESSESLFTPQARTGKTINRLLGELTKLNEQASKVRQPIEDFRRLREETERVREEVESLERERSELDTRRALYRRFADLFGDHIVRHELGRDLAGLDDVPLPTGDSEARWEELKSRMTEATVRVESAASAREATEKELAALGDPSPLLAHGDRIDSLDRRALLLENEGRDVDDAERERARLTRSADEALASIGALATRADLEALALPKNFAETIRKLLDERRDLDSEESGYRFRLQQMQARLEELKSSGSDDDLDRRLGRLDEVLRAAEEATRKSSQERDALAEAARARSVFVSDWIAARFETPVEPAKLSTVAIPALEAIDDEIERRRRFEIRREALDGSRRELHAKLIEAEARLDAAAAENLPSPDDLVAKRALRDELLRRLRARLSPTPHGAPSNSEEENDGVESLIASLADAVREADRVADVLAKEAGRCEQVKRDRAEAETLRKKLEASDVERSELSEESRRAEEAWSDRWKVAGVRANSPREMRNWRKEWEDRCRDVAEIAAKEAELRSLDESVRSAFENLAAELRDFEGDSASALEGRTSAALLLAAGKAKREAEGKREQAAKDRGELERLVQRDIPARVEALHSIAARRADWNERWRRAADKLPEGSRAVPQETLSFLDQFAEWRGLRDQERAIDERRAAFAARIEGFAKDVDALTEDLGEASAADRFAKTRRWAALLAEARKRDSAAASLRVRLEKTRDDVAAAEERLKVGQRELHEFCVHLGVDDHEKIASRLQAIRRKRLALEKAGVLDGHLNRLLPGRTWDALAQDLSAWSPETLDAEIRKIDGQIERLADDAKTRYVRLGELQDERKKWDGTSRAAEIEQDKQRLLAELSEAAEMYATYRLAASALQGAIDRYRDKNKSPILERAGKFFETLTLGKYRGLDPHDRPEGGIAVLGVRSDENEVPREVPVSAMSRGTCDQLYLAFRMALWEERLEKGPPIPIVLDDVLVHFDDDRAAATLRAFDELARRTQIVYFTHHQHLVELARRVLPAERLLVRELSQPAS